MTLDQFRRLYPHEGIHRIEARERSAEEVLERLGEADVYAVDAGLVIREKGASKAELVSATPAQAIREALEGQRRSP